MSEASCTKEKGKKMVGKGVTFERTRRITGYLVGTLKRFNNAKRAEEKDRIKHDVAKLPVHEEASKLPVSEEASKLPVHEEASKLPVSEEASKLPVHEE